MEAISFLVVDVGLGFVALDDVELAVVIFGERADASSQNRDPLRARRLCGGVERRDRSSARVGVHVLARKPRDRMAAVHVAADDRAHLGVAQLIDRPRRPGITTAVRQTAERSLPCRPSVALAARDAIDLLVGVLAYVADPEVAGLPIERDPPRLAKSDRVRLGPHLGRKERVVRGYAEALAGGHVIDVDAQDLAAQDLRIRRLQSALAPSDVEVTVRPELQRGYGMIGNVLALREQNGLGREIDTAVRRRSENRHARFLLRRNVRREDPRIGRKARVQREILQPPLIAELHAIRDVEHRRDLVAAHALHEAPMHDHEPRIGIARVLERVSQLLESQAAEHRDERNRIGLSGRGWADAAWWRARSRYERHRDECAAALGNP
jgi:hypothetical protein